MHRRATGFDRSIPKVAAWRNRQTRVPQEHAGFTPVRVRVPRPRPHDLETRSPPARGTASFIRMAAARRRGCPARGGKEPDMAEKDAPKDEPKAEPEDEPREPDWKAEARKWERRAKENVEKARAYDEMEEAGFDYQSERHRSKTPCRADRRAGRLITSQNDTAPKRSVALARHGDGLITSQNDTAPKQVGVAVPSLHGLITSQNDTAPKRRVDGLGRAGV